MSDPQSGSGPTGTRGPRGAPAPRVKRRPVSLTSSFINSVNDEFDDDLESQPDAAAPPLPHQPTRSEEPAFGIETRRPDYATTSPATLTNSPAVEEEPLATFPRLPHTPEASASADHRWPASARLQEEGSLGSVATGRPADTQSAYPDALTYNRLVELVGHLDRIRSKRDPAVSRQRVVIVALETFLDRLESEGVSDVLRERLRARKAPGASKRQVGFRLPEDLDVRVFNLWYELNPERRKAPKTRITEVALEEFLAEIEPRDPSPLVVARLRAT